MCRNQNLVKDESFHNLHYFFHLFFKTMRINEKKWFLNNLPQSAVLSTRTRQVLIIDTIGFEVGTTT